MFLGFVQNKHLAQNLIINGSFESYNNPVDCNGGGGFFNISTTPTTRVVNDWDICLSPDYFTIACPNWSWYSIPNCIFGYNQAKNGNAFAGIGTFSVTGGASEYIYQLLSSPLQAGKVYCVSFYVSRADRKEYALKNLGAYLSVSTPTMVSGSYISSIPQVINQNGFITDTVNWTQIQGCYTAMGGEQYITIGNFNSNANTDTLYVGTNNPIPNDPEYAYYYIDDITLIDQSTVDINDLEKKNGFEIYPNPNNGMFWVNTLSEEKNTLQIINAIGQVVKTQDILKGNTVIDLSNEKNGIYFYRILVKDKVIKTDKIVIIK
jgi:hypothetical protein